MTESDAYRTPSSLPTYRRGTWGTHPDVLAGSLNGTIEELLKERGYEAVMSGLGPEWGVEFHIYATSAPGLPQFFVEAILGGRGFDVYAGDIADLLDLLARWAPLVTASTVAKTHRELLDVDYDQFSHTDLASRLGARIAHGASRGDAWAAEQEQIRSGNGGGRR